MASYISDKLVTSDHEALAAQAMVGNQQAMQRLVDDLAADSGDIATQYLQSRLRKFLHAEVGFDKRMSSYISGKLVTQDQEALAAQAIVGDQQAMQRLMEDLAADSEDIMTHYFQCKFRKFLRMEIGFDQQMAKYISKKIVTRDHEARAAQAMAGDQQAMQCLMKDLGADSGDIVTKYFQLKLAKYLEAHFSLDHARAASVSEQIVTQENIGLVERALDGDGEALEQVGQRVAVLSAASLLSGLFH